MQRGRGCRRAGKVAKEPGEGGVCGEGSVGGGGETKEMPRRGEEVLISVRNW